MKTRRWIDVAGLVLLLLPAGAAVAGVEERVLHDAKRGRDVPVKITTPPPDAADAGGLRPAVFFSHGLGGSTEAAGYLGEALAARGYVFVNLQHAGSDASVWEGVPRAERLAAMKGATKDPRRAAARPLDASFALDTLLADDALRIDPERVGIAGHSFGAFTVRAVLGQRFGRGNAVSFEDPRFRAGLHLSGQPIRDAAQLAGVTAPCLSVTGTEDTSPVSPGVTAEDRRDFFELSPARHRYLIVYEAADHAVFGGNRGPVRTERDAALDAHVQGSVAAAAGLFFDAFLAVPVKPLPAGALRALVGPGDEVAAR